jgi:hypothetical protein
MLRQISIINNRPPYNFRLADSMLMENESFLKFKSYRR